MMTLAGLLVSAIFQNSSTGRSKIFTTRLDDCSALAGSPSGRKHLRTISKDAFKTGSRSNSSGMLARV